MEKSITVSQLNRYVLSLLESDSNLSSVSVTGEISSFKKYSSGHLYFSLKDENSQVSCVMFRNNAMSLNFDPEDGMAVLAKGKASLYERNGKFQLYIVSMVPEGVGSLHVAFEKLKEKLSKEGLFDASHKKKIPVLPKRIGVVTSPSGAVIKDIINVLSRRFSNFNLLLYPCVVQGENAGQSISKAIRNMNMRQDIDVLIVGRGGGSIEDLWAFNEEIVARTVFESRIPVISAVGHETDFTICDFTADLRASTPSAAAELAIPMKSDLLSSVDVMRKKLDTKLKNKYEYEKMRLKNITGKRVFQKPEGLYEKKKQDLIYAEESLKKCINDILKTRRENFNRIITRIDSLSPMKVLLRGYAIVNPEGSHKPLKSVEAVKVDDKLGITLTDGELKCKVTKIRERDKSDGR